jgi:hypothetical protein
MQEVPGDSSIRIMTIRGGLMPGQGSYFDAITSYAKRRIAHRLPSVGARDKSDN